MHNIFDELYIRSSDSRRNPGALTVLMKRSSEHFCSRGRLLFKLKAKDLSELLWAIVGCGVVHEEFLDKVGGLDSDAVTISYSLRPIIVLNLSYVQARSHSTPQLFRGFFEQVGFCLD